MSLIVENGTGLADADSYISLVDARAYAVKYGYTLPIDDDEADVSLRKGAVYVDVGLFEGSFSGERVNEDQSLSWPRKNAYRCNGYNQVNISPSTIPNEVKYAQVIAANYYAKGDSILVNDDGLSVASKEVVGAVKISYFDNGKTGKSTEITEAVVILSSYLCVGSSLTLKTLRV